MQIANLGNSVLRIPVIKFTTVKKYIIVIEISSSSAPVNNKEQMLIVTLFAKLVQTIIEDYSATLEFNCDNCYEDHTC